MSLRSRVVTPTVRQLKDKDDNADLLWSLQGINEIICVKPLV